MRSRGLHDGCRTYGGAAWLKHCRGGDLWGDNDLGDSSTAQVKQGIPNGTQWSASLAVKKKI
ncbi:hypothetical protein E2562_038130 [Oryza meyeriana var. granulata]|uniref:Uncharacterized protein n=1 Tax=Oryza meyeriana var. granulata TaxID=110450 RepID=A0A6G1CXK4_9ORYZ|nr:hypothetical protein E2562_038130 [Oryza meyeriana var. granulata]KAF0904852.1 hypothetical protein E2562_038130 [Oryza meyeriana var. granulata]KAF0904853.1 hypothetical protein E2562_038130 [Oryza meyeriana var. granulata]KAF0904856.1 hypothetical protein E2562_038130 [Oryza meyeriana var. granulata]KAF0904857.1 hypothetical protein E2562_038130 [Oryza meyeriana var. granulata]